MEEISLPWERVKQIREIQGKSDRPSLQQVLKRHEVVFKEELGILLGTKATIHVSPSAQPKFYRSRAVPYAMRAKINAEIDRLLKEEIIKPVQYSEWAAPVVPVLKPDGSIRLCGDYKLTVNQVATLEHYPIPRVEDLFATLSGGKQFTKLDMSHAYLQLLLDDTSKQYLTVNTHRGLFTYNRLPFGVASAPAIFQRVIEGLLQGIPHVAIYLDDILVTGTDEEEHLRNLEEVLTRMEKAGLHLRKDKCSFLQREVQYLGHRVDAQGLHPLESKVQAIVGAPSPKSVSELKAYLGLLNYYGRFLPNLSTLLAPLHSLLKKDVQWGWGKAQEKAFRESKQLLESATRLVHYSPSQDLILACDASAYGVGAVLSHRMPDGSESPLGFVSRTLSPAEKKYSQLDKEALAIILGIKKFHKYLYGRTFTVCTDHKPLMALFGEKKSIPQMGSPRVQRWAILLSAYEYQIGMKLSWSIHNADALSRLPLLESPEEEKETEQVLMIDCVDAVPVDSKQIRSWTAKDPLLSQVRRASGPVNGINSFILQELPAYSLHMRLGIVVHQEEPRTHCTSVGSDNGSEDFILVKPALICEKHKAPVADLLILVFCGKCQSSSTVLASEHRAHYRTSGPQ
ncbi:hypothetical protein NFI96_006341, partial [Prochilodus magdalenae]